VTGLPVCGSCGAPMRWGVTSTSGARMPLDPVPSSEGSVWIRPDGRLRALTAVERVRALEAGEELYRTHWETCPAAERHRSVSRDQLGFAL
jgi:hypothetical protein